MTTEYAEVDIEITRELAMRGSRWVCSQCPVALAINQHLRPGLQSYVGKEMVQIVGSRSHVSQLPTVAHEFIRRFDHQLPINFPVTFRLALPKQVLKEAA